MIGRQGGDFGYDELTRFVETESGDGRALVRNPEDNPICSILYDIAIPSLVIRWKGYATSAQLRFIHETLIHLISKYRADRILGDDTALPTISERDQDWITHSWMPRAIAFGLRWAAAKRPHGYFGQASVSRIHTSAPPGLTVRSFESLEEAKQWLERPTADQPKRGWK
jgi:hypothetical protein